MKYPSSRIKTSGSSMYPLLSNQDTLYLRKIRFSNIKVGDIICCKKNNKILTHQVIYKTKNFLIAKGEDNSLSDGKIYPKQIVGKVYKVKKGDSIFNPESIYLFQSTFYFQEIVKVKNALQKKKTDFLFLKGLPLHLHFEKSHPKRIYGDCDILVSRSDFPTVEEILVKFGYERITTSPFSQIKRLKDNVVAISFSKLLNSLSVVFDVHLEVVFMMTQLGKLNTLYSQALIDSLTDEFLKEKKMAQIQNEIFPILSLNNLFLYLALHLFHHNFQGAYRYEFINTLINTNELEYQLIAQKINKYRLQSFLYPCFLLLNKHYKVRFPRNFLKSIEPEKSKLQSIKKNILNMDIFGEEEIIESRIDRFKNIFFLSQNSLYKKVLVFLNPQVIYAIVWILLRRLKFK